MRTHLLFCLRRPLALLIGLLMLPVPALAQARNQHAGKISALIPAATCNKKQAGVQDTLHWNDLLNTDTTGRLRAGLLDGSILSLGRESHLTVVQHNARLQQTALQLEYGRIRSQVAALTRSAAKFELRTPVAVVGVIGTDFYVFTTADMTRVICYSGKVVVTPTAAPGEAPDSPWLQPITLLEGQMVELHRGLPATPETLTADARNESLAETEVAEAAAPVAPRSWLSRHKHIVIGVGAAAVAGVVAGATTGGKKGGSSPTCTNCGHVD